MQVLTWNFCVEFIHTIFASDDIMKLLEVLV